jgi:hypothetical protein
MDTELLEKFKKDLIGQDQENIKDGWFKENQADFLEAVADENLNPSKIRFYTDLYSNLIARRAMANYLQGNSESTIGFLDSFKMMKYILLLNEYALYTLAQGAISFSDYLEEFSTNNVSSYITHAWRLCGQYYFEEDDDWNLLIPLFEIGSYRGDIEDVINYSVFAIQLPLLKLLFQPESFEISLNELSKHKPLEFLSDGWQDDEIFKEGLNKACDWHLEQALRSEQGVEGAYGEPFFTLLPIWIFALDKRRSKEIGHSSLPDNPLIQLGKDFLSLPPKGESDPVIPKIAAICENFYDELGDQVDLPTFWKEFIKT